MAEIIGVVIGAIVTIGKIVYDECRKIGEKVTSCGGKPDDTPVPDEDEDEEPRRFKVELGQETIRRLIKRSLT
jgi:hypothetical protein